MPPSKDVIDVEFETIAANSTYGENKQAPSRDRRNDTGPTDADQLAVFGSRGGRREPKPMSLPLFALVAAICTMGAFYLAGGHTLLGRSATPGSVRVPEAEPSNPVLQPLSFENITSNIVERSNLKVLTIRATIINNDEIPQVIPAIIVRLGDDPATGRMFRVNRGETLLPGERLVFTNSLPIGNAPATKPQLSFSE